MTELLRVFWHFKIRILPILIFSLYSCSKEEFTNNNPVNIQWMKVLSDSVILSSDDEMFQGRNGKVLTDRNDNIYCYLLGVNPSRTIVKKFNPSGELSSIFEFQNCEPADMNILEDGTIVLAVRLSSLLPQGLVLYYIRQDGSVDSLVTQVQSAYSSLGISNAYICPLTDNGLIISGSFQQQKFTNGSIENIGFVLKVSSGMQVTNKVNVSDENLGPSFTGGYFGQNSVVSTNSGNYVFQFGISRNQAYQDSIGYGLLTGTLNYAGDLDTFYFNHTGYEVRSTGNRNGFYNRYCNGLMSDNSNLIYHYSSPMVLADPKPAVPNGFLRIDDDAKIMDTIPLSLPAGYRIVSCTRGSGRFLMIAYRTGVVSGTNDYSAYHTLFLTGDGNWQPTSTFTLQEFYSDFFHSAAPTSDGGYIIMGKIQSFNGEANKLVLIKWKN